MNNIDINNETRFLKNYDKIMKILNYANQTDYYSKIICQLNLNLNSLTYDEFRRIPYLTKEIYRNNTFGVVRKSILSDFNENIYDASSMGEKDQMLAKYGLSMRMTSGSTGKPLEVIKSNTDNLREYTAINYYRKKIYHIDLNKPFVWVWPVSPYFLKEVPDIKKISSVNNGFRYLISAFSDEEFTSLTEYCYKKNINWITSSPSMLYSYSTFLLKKNISVIFDYIESHSEPLLSHQKETIQKALGSDPINVYGSNEVQFIGMTCPNNHMHILENNVFVETEKNEYGYDEVIVTSLSCFDSILLRYRIGDCAFLKNSNENCIYSKNNIIELKNYRSNDLSISKNSNERYEPHLITASIYALEEKYKIKITNYRIVQKNYSEFLYYIEIIKIEEDYENFFERYLQDLFRYPINVHIKPFDSYSGTYEGKFKYFSIDADFAKVIKINE